MRIHVKRIVRLSLVALRVMIAVVMIWAPGLYRPAADDDPSHDRSAPLVSLTRQRDVRASASLVYPSLEYYDDDRISRQLEFVAQSVAGRKERGEAVSVKKILLNDDWNTPLGSTVFEEDKCAVRACELVRGMFELAKADVVLAKSVPQLAAGRPLGQIWVLFMLESPVNTPHFGGSYRGLVNWTATYRHDSTIVAPYEKFVPLNDSLLVRNPVKNFARGKTKKVAWFVSNCGASNRRLEYAQELSRYIPVDIYGHCGSLTCGRHEHERCFSLLDKDYKFYLSFENSNCRDYITEKFFINGLK